MNKLILTLALLAVATPSHAQTSKLQKILLYGSWIGCQSFDGISTYLAKRDPRLVEGNPILRGPQLYPMKIGINVGLTLMQHAFVKAHPTAKSRFLIPLTAAGSGCLAGGLNTRTIRHAR